MDDLTALVLHALEVALAVDGRELVSWKIHEPKTEEENK